MIWDQWNQFQSSYRIIFQGATDRTLYRDNWQYCMHISLFILIVDTELKKKTNTNHIACFVFYVKLWNIHQKQSWKDNWYCIWLLQKDWKVYMGAKNSSLFPYRLLMYYSRFEKYLMKGKENLFWKKHTCNMSL